MNKTVILLLLSAFLLAESAKIEFLETRYIEALNEKVTKKGEVEFGANHTSIRYFKPNAREMTLKNDAIYINDSIVQKDTREERELTSMLTLLGAIFKKDETTVKSFFTITNGEDEVVLTPISTSAHIFKITYAVDEDEISRIEFFFWDDSRITIDVVKKK